MRQLLFSLTLLTPWVSAAAPRKVWQPARGLKQISIWPGEAPDAQRPPGPETMAVSKRLFGGRPLIGISNVSKPTITVYPAKGRNTGVAVVVFPGGGYIGLAIDLEGSEACEWLASRGITGILLKYRVPFSGPYWDEKLKRQVQPKAPMALQDAQRAIRLARLNARKWGLNPHKIGVLGFSAGGHMVAATSTHFSQPSYRPRDAADLESCRPDFAIALYPGHLWNWTATDNPNFDLNPDIATRITA